MSYIYRVYNSKTIAVLTSKDDAISLLYNIPNAKIEVFNNITPIGLYNISNNKLYFNDSEVLLDGYMNKWFNSNTDVKEKSELNVFIPFSIEETNINKKLSLEELQLKIKRLEEEANNNNEKLEEIKEVCDNVEEEFNQKKEEFDEEKKNFEKEKENVYQLKNKLEADKRVYFIVKEQLESGELTEDSIPILFLDKYPIFKYLDENNLITDNDTITTEEINNYLKIEPQYKLNTNINVENSNAFNDLFSSSDPIYSNKKNINTDDSSD